MSYHWIYNFKEPHLTEHRRRRLRRRRRRRLRQVIQISPSSRRRRRRKRRRDSREKKLLWNANTIIRDTRQIDLEFESFSSFFKKIFKIKRHVVDAALVAMVPRKKQVKAIRMIKFNIAIIGCYYYHIDYAVSAHARTHTTKTVFFFHLYVSYRIVYEMMWRINELNEGAIIQFSFSFRRRVASWRRIL